MAFSRAKKAAIDSVYSASKKLRMYRQLPMESIFDFGPDVNTKHTIADIKKQAEHILMLTQVPLESATEKQIKLLKKMILDGDCGLYDMKVILNFPLNKYQASELIEFCLYVNDRINIHFNYTTKEDCDEMEEQQKQLIEFYNECYGK